MVKFDLEVKHLPTGSVRVVTIYALSRLDAVRVLAESIDTHGGTFDDYRVSEEN